MKQEHVYLNNMLRHYCHQLEEQKKELREMPNGYLAVRTDLKQPAYVWVRRRTTPGDNDIKYERKTITDRQKLIQRLARKKYLEKSTKLLAEEIHRINRFLEESTEPTPDNVLKLLPKTYQSLPKGMFFPERKAAHQWAAAAYEQNTLYPEEKIHTTGRGLKVRSKSELFIADRLDRYLFPFRYDANIYFENHAFSPDFSIMTKEGIIYWEHCGMMSIPEYRKRNKWKLAMYDKMGIVPWKNLIVTYDTEDGGLNLAVIEAEIRNKLLPIRI